MLNGGPIEVPQCDKPAWVFLGISMAGWNALISLTLTVLSAIAALAAPPKATAR
jgi:disulfide bond formation protein DsbB